MSASRRLKRQSTKRKSLTGDPYKRFKGPSVLDQLIARRKAIIRNMTEHGRHESGLGDAVSFSCVSSYMWGELMQIEERLRNEFHVDPELMVASRASGPSVFDRLSRPISNPMDLLASNSRNNSEPLPPVSGWNTLDGGA